MPTSIKISDELKERIQRLADARNRSPHFVMREAIREYVIHEEAKESFKQEALHSWKHYQETGRHLTLSETRSWLNAWGKKTKKAIPSCHE